MRDSKAFKLLSKELNKQVQLKPLCSPAVVTISQKIDRLVLQEMKNESHNN
jgi:hypothetical protein